MKALIGKLTILIATITLAACFDDPGTDITWGNKAYFELDRAGQASPVVSKTYNRLNDGTKADLDVQVNIMGKAQKEDVSVTFEIDPASTAIAGVHYNKLTAGNTLTIPAGENVANIEFEVMPDNINTGETWTLIVKLVDGDLPIATDYDSAKWNLRITCNFPGRAAFTGSYSVNEPGYGSYGATLTADGTNANGVRTDNFWDFGGDVLYVLDPATNKVTVPTQTITMGGEGWVISKGGAGDGTYDPCTKKMTIPYKVVRVSNGLTYDDNTHTYTKN